MPESVVEVLERISSFLHWLEKYREAKIITMFIVWVRKNKIETFEELEAHVLGEAPKGEEGNE